MPQVKYMFIFYFSNILPLFSSTTVYHAVLLTLIRQSHFRSWRTWIWKATLTHPNSQLSRMVCGFGRVQKATKRNRWLESFPPACTLSGIGQRERNVHFDSVEDSIIKPVAEICSQAEDWWLRLWGIFLCSQTLRPLQELSQHCFMRPDFNAVAICQFASWGE